MAGAGGGGTGCVYVHLVVCWAVSGGWKALLFSPLIKPQDPKGALCGCGRDWHTGFVLLFCAATSVCVLA